MVVDFHSHFFSRPFFEELALRSPRAGSVDEKLAAVVAKTGIEIPPEDVEAHLRRWLDELDRKGVSHLHTFASLPEEIPAVRKAVELAGGRLSACALIDPKAPESDREAWSLLTEEGFHGILLFPAMHHYRLTDPEAEKMLHAVNERRGLVFVHCGLLVVKLRDLLGLPRPYDLGYANPLDVIPAANRAPRAKFIIPHFGAGFFRETLMAGTQCENVYVDTSSSNSWIVTQPGVRDLEDVCARTLAVFGAERILFGTDSNVFPAGWRKDRLDEQQAAFRAAGATDAQMEMIFAGNARRLLDDVGQRPGKGQ